MSIATLSSLVELSARLGQDSSLVQAGGGNTSLKDHGKLWIKASGKWMAEAARDDMFVPVPLADIRTKLATGDEKFPEYRTGSGALLRPSVETSMHAVLPHRVVIHVHSVAAIAWAAQKQGKEALAARLAGLRWAWIPYIHPGLPLALRIQEDLIAKPDVLVLGNHGLVVAADDCASAEALLLEVELRLATEVRTTPLPQFSKLIQLAQGTGWRVLENEEVHSLATSAAACEIASAGTMYPDHCVYLGPAAPCLRPGESLDSAIESYRERHQYEPGYVLVEESGVLVNERLTRAGRELLLCLKRVVERIPSPESVHYLEDWQVAKLMNWDAEKYRLTMARQHE